MFSAPVSARNLPVEFSKPTLSRHARRWLAAALAGALVAAGCATIRNPATAQISAADASATPTSRLRGALGNAPLYFIENRGQVDPRAAFYLRGKDKTLYFTAEGITFILNRARRRSDGTMLVNASAPAESSESSEFWDRWALKLDFVRANAVAPRGEESTPAVVSYFTGGKDRWQPGLKTYAKLVYADLWPGIDLIYGGSEERLKYMFVVKPGTDPKQIQLAYRGVSSLRVNERQELEIGTPAGDFHDDRPYAYQDIAGRRAEVPMAYELQAGARETGRYGFRVGKYDRAQPLVLDPAIIIYSGFIGGLLDDKANGVAVDSAGAAYVTGETSSDETTFPDGNGFGPIAGNDEIQNGGVDAFVAKVKPDGSGLVYATFIGGSGTDRGNAIALAGGCAPPCEAYITGETDSTETTFPTTSGAFDITQNGVTDAFVIKVNAAGTDLVYSTFIGGSATDRGKGIAVDGAGLAYVTGETNSSHVGVPNAFPVTTGPDLTQNGLLDAFVARLSAAGDALDYLGYIGGGGDDRGNAIALEPGCASPCAAYVAGETSSTEASFPDGDGFGPLTGPDLTQNGGIDAFVAKVKADGTGLDYAGFIGGSLTDRANGIAVDGLGKAYVAGETNSLETSFPDGNGFGALPGADKIQNGGVDAFVVRLNAAGTALDYATYIGGINDDRANAIALNPGCASPCEAYIAGETGSDQLTFPDKVGPDVTHNGGVDAFVAKVKDDGTSLLLAGYIGGSGDERANAIAVDTAGAAYVAGETNSTTLSTSTVKFPVRTGPDKVQNGAIDAFVTKLCTTGCLDLTSKMTAAPKIVMSGGTITYNFTITNKGPDDATNVVLDDPVPAGAGFVSAIPSVGACNAVVHCTLGPLAKGALPITVEIKFAAPAFAGSFVNTATVAADQTDTSPGNNESTIKTSVLLPDFVIKKLSLSATTVAAGGTITVTDTTSNSQSVPVAPATTAGSTTAFYLSTDKLFSGDTLLTSRLVGGLSAKGTSTGATPVTIPLATVPGTYYIIAVADDGNAVVETPNEGNNSKASKKITVTP